ncbi:hypothetical protein MHUMG1_08380 [Metarhizium humberi]|uniref:Ferric reductase NAD binding domain-containing protein n=1 Tax=Metarhizium humberi TaxID=2596975 RepID=A0A9P8M5S5_9HYPO|nr:hypothetical protein MHUMG1_08380 [Metarhizium humberi]
MSTKQQSPPACVTAVRYQRAKMPRPELVWLWPCIWNQKCPASFIGHLRLECLKKEKSVPRARKAAACPIVDDQYTAAARAYFTSVFGVFRLSKYCIQVPPLHRDGDCGPCNGPLRRDGEADEIESSFANTRIRIGTMAWLCLAIILPTALPVVRRKGQVVSVQLWCIILELASLHGGASIWAYSNAVQYVGTDTGSERQPSVGKAYQSANRKDKLRLNGPASGIGITPAVGIMSSIVSLRHSLTRRSVTIPPGIADIHLFWVVKSIQHSAWFKKELQTLHDVISQPGSTVRLSISPYHAETGSTQTTRQQEESSSAEKTEYMPTWWTISLGRPDLDSVFEGLEEQHAGCDVGVGLCGPNEMVRRARNVAVGASSTTGLFHIEDFESIRATSTRRVDLAGAACHPI